MEEQKLNLYQKIQAVAIEVMNLEKDMSVGQGTYAYRAVSDNQVTLAVKKAEKKFGLLSIPIKQDLISSEVVRTIKDNNKESLTFVDNIKMTVRIIDVDDPTNFIDIETFGKGVDSGDKGFGKASTYARKYALLNAYKIATGEDPDKEKSDEKATLSENEKKTLVISACMKSEKLKEDVLGHFGLGSLDDLDKKQIEMLFKEFSKKKYI